MMTQKVFAIVFAGVLLAGCRGMESEAPPIHPNLNMDFQRRLDPQEAHEFFADGRAMRVPVAGTVPRGMLREDAPFYFGRTEAGGYVEAMPLPTTREVLLRGQERYNIYCTPCHGLSGTGQGIVTTGGFGYTPAPTFHSETLREVPDGYLFDVITNGVRTMPPYGHQVPVADRWAIVAYIRALQRSQYATEADVPPGLLPELRRQPATGAGAAGAGDADADTAGIETSPADTAGAQQ